jgi:hypothetical protein
MQATFIVVDKDRSGYMHGIAEQKTLSDAALSEAFLHLRGYIAKLPSGRDIKPEFFPIRFQLNLPLIFSN